MHIKDAERAESMWIYELWIDGQDRWYGRHQEVAPTAGKAKYQYYQYLQDGIFEAPFGELIRRIRCRKVGAANVTFFYGDKEHFERIKEMRGIPFIYQGMRVEVDGRPGTLVGTNSSCNLNVVFDEYPWIASNCHPYWRVKYFGTDGQLVKEYA